MDSKKLKQVNKRRLKVLLNPIKNYLKVSDVNKRAKYSRWYENLPLKNNYVLYESRDGKSMTDSPYAIFKYFIQDHRWKDLVHVWVISDKDYLKSVRKKYEKHSNVRFVLRNTEDRKSVV